MIDMNNTMNLNGEICVSAHSIVEPCHGVEKCLTPRKHNRIIWRNVLMMATLHLLFVWSIVRFPSIDPRTLAFTWLLGQLSSIGVTVGVHRLWSHRSYKANTGVRLFLMLCQTLSLQNDILHWARDHRAHHKWAETDADPHNSRRGFFFSHIGWLLVTKHPEVVRKGATVDVSDLHADPIVMFQHKYYVPLVGVVWAGLPIAIPHIFWNETLLNAFLAAVIFRFVLVLNITWMLNSWAHMENGVRPYDQRQAAVDLSFFRDLVLGDGHHNYHHTFPWDYSQSELGPWDVYNPSTVLINVWNRLGWAWDLKKANPETVEQRIKTRGDPELERYTQGDFVSKYAKGLAAALGPLWFMLVIHCAF